jgi:N-acetylneuraminic acid mutarotase
MRIKNIFFLFIGIVFFSVSSAQLIPFGFWASAIHFNQIWVWVSGVSTYDSLGTYGTKGVTSGSNMPGAREAAIAWVDGNENIWIFGGYGFASTGAVNYLNDLWEYTPTTGQWTWIAGANTTLQAGTYGTQGVGSTANIPRARGYLGKGWTDVSGNTWLFGGASAAGYHNDLWKFNPTNNQWTWVSGSSSVNQNGAYGAQGTGSTANIPGSRYNNMNWVDNSGNFWIFGGWGYPASGTTKANMNDLWKYTPADGKWMWVSGVSTLSAASTCGTQGTGSTANTPGSRIGAATWSDSFGNLWLFGGLGKAGGGGSGILNDLWKFNPTSGQWTWMTGACATTGGSATYGTKGVAASGNVPGARQFASGWMDAAGNLWFFGGDTTAAGYNDVWMYAPATGYWTWKAGANTTNVTGTYGVQGIYFPLNAMGARSQSMSVYSSEAFWVFGGSDGSGSFNDLWRSQN